MDYIKNAVKLRRELHQIPELGWGEFCTTAKILETIEPLGWKTFVGVEQIGLDAVMGRPEDFVEKSKKRALEEGVDPTLIERMHGYTGTIAELDTGRPGPVTALRFDIDCVGVEETDLKDHLPNKENFRSRHAGVMHSCGHDGHTAVGLTMAQWIVDHKDQLCGRIKLIFQPAEEGVRGGAAQAASGLLDDVNYLLGAHLAMMCPTGEVCVYPEGVLCTTKLDVRFKGRPAHPTMSPHLGRNALACACTCVSELLGMARHGKGLGCINVGMMQAGELNNDPELASLVTEVAGSLPSCERVVQHKKLGCSEDFTMLATRVKAAGGKSEFFVVGADRTAAHHQREFDFDEKGLETAFGIFKGCVLKLNGI